MKGRLVGLIVIILVQQVGLAAAQTGPECETRGVWLNPYAFEEAGARWTTLMHARQANLNTLLVLTPPVVDANGVQHNGWAEHEAYVSLLKAAKQRGFQVHGWVANYYRKPGGVDYRYSREWEQQANWAIALLDQYPELDGIHFDYIRYSSEPQLEHQTSEKMASVSWTVRTAFYKIKRKYPNKFLTAAVFNVDPWEMAPSAFVPAWFKAWKAAHPADSIYYDPSYPRAIYGPRSFRVAQDPVMWLNGKYIDAVMPIIYTADLDIWQKRLPLWRSFVGEDDFSKVWFGLAWFFQGSYTITWPDGSQFATGNPLLPGQPEAAAEALVRQIDYARSQGMKGFTLFELGHPSVGAANDRVLVEKLRDGPFSQPVPSCLQVAMGDF